MIKVGKATDIPKEKKNVLKEGRLEMRSKPAQTPLVPSWPEDPPCNYFLCLLTCLWLRDAA